MKHDTVEGLRFRHAQGRELLDQFPVGVAPGEPWPARPQYHTGGVFDARARELGITLQELHSRRRFAFLYSDEDLDRLCSYVRPLSWSSIKWLLRVDDRDKRLELEREAAEKGWTVEDLKAEFRRRKKDKHGGGRPPKLPTTLTGGVDVIADAASRLEVLLEHVLTGEGSLAKKQRRTPRTAEEKRQTLLAAAKVASEALTELQNAIDPQRSRGGRG